MKQQDQVVAGACRCDIFQPDPFGFEKQFLPLSVGGVSQGLEIPALRLDFRSPAAQGLAFEVPTLGIGQGAVQGDGNVDT